VAPQNILTKISAHLHSASDRINTPASQTQEHISLAQGVLKRMLGELPLKGAYPPKKPIEHLEEADALAQEHLGLTGPEADLARQIRQTLSTAKKEL
jgi:hypothetical protein